MKGLPLLKINIKGERGQWEVKFQQMCIVATVQHKYHIAYTENLLYLQPWVSPCPRSEKELKKKDELKWQWMEFFRNLREDCFYVLVFQKAEQESCSERLDTTLKATSTQIVKTTVTRSLSEDSPRWSGACFSKVLKLFGWHNSLSISETKASRGTKLCSYFNFYSLYNI